MSKYAPGWSADGGLPMTGDGVKKVSKPSVDYRTTKSAVRRCGTCSMFRAPGSCTLVAGNIRRQDVCDRWEKKR